MHNRLGLVILNMFMTILLALLVGAVGVLLVLATAGALSASTSFDGLFAEIITRLDSSDGPQSVINYVIGVGLIMIGAVLIFIQSALFARQDNYLTIQDSEIGTMKVSRSSIEELAERTMKADKAVVACDCSLDEIEGELVVKCRTRIAMGADVTRVAEEGQHRTKEAVENLLGVAVREVDVRASYVGNQKGHLATVE